MFKYMIAAAALLASVPANAQCVWTWDCTSGQCKQVPVCRNVIDIPPVRPMELPPIAPPSVRPILPPALPLPGTKVCTPRYVCSSSGQCTWQQVCQ
jgi:hypothetical protein